jgi:hypothetical protein
MKDASLIWLMCTISKMFAYAMDCNYLKKNRNSAGTYIKNYNASFLKDNYKVKIWIPLVLKQINPQYIPQTPVFSLTTMSIQNHFILENKI